MSYIDRDETYNTVIENVWKEYEPKVRTFLERLADAMRREGWDVGHVYDLSDDVYRLTFSVARDQDARNDNDTVDITCELGEAAAYGEDEGFGVSFRLDCVEYDGRILISWAPYNYTDLCWVDARDPEALNERWHFFADVQVEDFVPFITGEREGGGQPLVFFMPAREKS